MMLNVIPEAPTRIVTKMTTTIPQNLVLHEFDDVATRLGVFKVDTIGDFHVAVSGSKQKSCYNHGQSID
jgi:hypothetical protein